MADLVLISHLHADHAHLPSLRRISASTVLIAPTGSRRLLGPITARGPNLCELSPGQSVDVRGLRIVALAADHDGRRLPGSFHRAPALGFLIEGSRRCWYPGDTGPRLALDRLGRIDMALVPVGGWGPSLGAGHLDARQAAAVVCHASPEHAVPVHWGTWWPVGLRDRPDLIDSPGPEFAEQVSRLGCSTSVHVLRHAESLTLN